MKEWTEIGQVGTLITFLQERFWLCWVYVQLTFAALLFMLSDICCVFYCLLGGFYCEGFVCRWSVRATLLAAILRSLLGRAEGIGFTISTLNVCILLSYYYGSYQPTNHTGGGWWCHSCVCVSICWPKWTWKHHWAQCTVANTWRGSEQVSSTTCNRWVSTTVESAE